MFRKKRVHPMERVEVGRDQLRRVTERGVQGATAAKKRLGPAAQSAREVAAERVLEARVWSAPQLERAAHYVEAELGPRVGSALSKTAHVVEPQRHQRMRQGRKAAVMTMVTVGMIGAVGAVMSRRNAAKSVDQSDDVSGRSSTESGTATEGKIHTP